MERTKVISSNVMSIGHDNITEILEVEFKGEVLYHYHNVPEDVFNTLLMAESVGKMLNLIVKGRYNYTKV